LESEVKFMDKNTKQTSRPVAMEKRQNL